MFIHFSHASLFVKFFCLNKFILVKKVSNSNQNESSFGDRYPPVSSQATTRPVAGAVLVNTTTTAAAGAVAATGPPSTTVVTTPWYTGCPTMRSAVDRSSRAAIRSEDTDNEAATITATTARRRARAGTVVTAVAPAARRPASTRRPVPSVRLLTSLWVRTESNKWIRTTSYWSSVVRLLYRAFQRNSSFPFPLVVPVIILALD